MELVYNNECYFGQDSSESLVVIGRYISENYDGAALHPIDFINISTGQLVAEVIDPNITTISPVNKLHPREDILASGSSRYGSVIFIYGSSFYMIFKHLASIICRLDLWHMDATLLI